jgi:hypothetical protein
LAPTVGIAVTGFCHPGEIQKISSSTSATVLTSPQQLATSDTTRRSRREEQVEADQDITLRMHDKERKKKKLSARSETPESNNF